jgi:hypothetical protein
MLFYYDENRAIFTEYVIVVFLGNIGFAGNLILMKSACCGIKK